MVQGESAVPILHHSSSVNSFFRTRSPEARKAGCEALKQQEQRRKEEEKQKYGAWGPVYKNKQHFASLHYS